MLLALSTEGWFLSSAARKTYGSEDTHLCSTAALHGIFFFFHCSPNLFVMLFSILILSLNLSLKLYNAGIMNSYVNCNSLVWRPLISLAVGEETVGMSNFVSFYHGLKSRLGRSGGVLGVRVRSGIQCFLSTASFVSDVE